MEALFLCLHRFPSRKRLHSLRGFKLCERGRNLCRHNLKYWNRAPYLGSGFSPLPPGRHSMVETCGPRGLLSGHGPGQIACCRVRNLTPEQVYLETILLGFRTRRWGGSGGLSAQGRVQRRSSGICSRPRGPNGRTEESCPRSRFSRGDSLPLLFSG